MMRPNGVEKQVRPKGTSERPDLDQYSLLSSTTLAGFTYPHGIAVSEDGTKLFIGPGSGTIRQYTMTGGLLSNISAVESTSSSITTRGLYCKPDGAELYSISDNKKAYTIDMPTPFSLSSSTANYITLGLGSPCGCRFTPNGDFLYCVDYSNNNVYKIPLSTSWDITTSSTTGMTNASLSGIGNLYNIAISPTGLKMFIGTWSNIGIYQYNLSTAWDITTATYSGKVLTGAWGRGTFSVTDGGDIFVTDTNISTPTVYQYTAS